MLLDYNAGGIDLDPNPAGSDTLIHCDRGSPRTTSGALYHHTYWSISARLELLLNASNASPFPIRREENSILLYRKRINEADSDDGLTAAFQLPVSPSVFG